MEELKNKIEAIKKSEAGALAKEMIQHIEALEMTAFISTMFSNI